jgi:hypothetical protein
MPWWQWPTYHGICRESVPFKTMICLLLMITSSTSSVNTLLLNNLGITQLTAPVADAVIAQLVYRLDNWGIMIWFLARERDLSLLQNTQTRVWGPPTLLLNGYRGHSGQGVKANQPPPSSTKVKNKGGYMSASCICLLDIHKDKFMVTFCCPWYQMGHFAMR